MINDTAVGIMFDRLANFKTRNILLGRTCVYILCNHNKIITKISLQKDIKQHQKIKQERAQ